MIYQVANREQKLPGEGGRGGEGQASGEYELFRDKCLAFYVDGCTNKKTLTSFAYSADDSSSKAKGFESSS